VASELARASPLARRFKRRGLARIDSAENGFVVDVASRPTAAKAASTLTGK